MPFLQYLAGHRQGRYGDHVSRQKNVVQHLRDLLMDILALCRWRLLGPSYIINGFPNSMNSSVPENAIFLFDFHFFLFIGGENEDQDVFSF